MIMGEKMPDKDDPKYRDRYEKEVEAGRRFAQMTKIDKAAAKVQGFAIRHSMAFLVIVFGLIIFSFCFNLYSIGLAYSAQKNHSTAIERQEQYIRNRRNHPSRSLQETHQNRDKQEINNPKQE